MVKILLIDDEPIITKGLKLIIERSEIACEIVGIAHSGEQGIKLACEFCPDIIIVDICMPIVDGLELISRLKTAGYSFQFIVLSGFQEFNYAKRAMLLEVKHFITKPVDEEEIFRALNCAISEIESRQNSTKKLKLLEESFLEHQEHLTNYMLRDLLIQADHTHEFSDYLLPENFFPSDSRQFGCIFLDFWEIGKTDFTEKYAEIIQTIEKQLNEFLCVKHILFGIQKIVIVIADNKTIEFKRLKNLIASMSTALMKNYMQISIGIGLIYSSITEISKSFENAKEAIEFRIFRGSSGVISFDETVISSPRPMNTSLEEIAAFQNFVKQLNEQEAMNELDIMFENFALQPGLTPLDLQLRCLSVLLSATKILSLTEYQLNDFLGKDVFSLSAISKFRDLNELSNYIKTIVCSIIELKADKNNTTKENTVIEDVIIYLDQNYSSETNLQLLSEIFFINPYYLSQLFKEKTGESYLNYLTSLRMNKAKYLLLKTDDKIYDISLQVGYSDTSYFSRLFERNTGVKPSQYRKQKQQET